MINQKHDNHEEDFSDSEEPISKTQRKQIMHELQNLGAVLVELTPGQLKRINIPENIYDAVRDYQRFTSHEAKRRQLQYIGKLMRSAEVEAIEAGLAFLRGESDEENAKLHRRERMRTRLMENEKVAEEILAQWPHADIGYLRLLRRNAIKELAENKAPKNFRLIYQTLKELEDNAPSSED